MAKKKKLNFVALNLFLSSNLFFGQIFSTIDRVTFIHSDQIPALAILLLFKFPELALGTRKPAKHVQYISLARSSAFTSSCQARRVRQPFLACCTRTTANGDDRSHRKNLHGTH